MTKEEAWRVIEECKNWNVGQKSWSFASGGERTQEDEVLDAKRAALAEAWRVVGMVPNAELWGERSESRTNAVLGTDVTIGEDR